MSEPFIKFPFKKESEPYPGLTTSRVMIFDDDKDLLDVCNIVLKFKNYEVRGLNKCRDIIREVNQFLPHVILMDNWIPDTGGVSATRQLKNDPQLKNIPVIFCSANDQVAELASEAGAEFFLQKPFEMEELENVVLLARSIHPGSGIRETDKM
jgi:DNA-binding response OmpR family regulator